MKRRTLLIGAPLLIAPALVGIASAEPVAEPRGPDPSILIEHRARLRRGNDDVDDPTLAPGHAIRWTYDLGDGWAATTRLIPIDWVWHVEAHRTNRIHVGLTLRMRDGTHKRVGCSADYVHDIVPLASLFTASVTVQHKKANPIEAVERLRVDALPHRWSLWR
jgi:hypothetical protein